MLGNLVARRLPVPGVGREPKEKAVPPPPRPGQISSLLLLLERWDHSRATPAPGDRREVLVMAVKTRLRWHGRRRGPSARRPIARGSSLVPSTERRRREAMALQEPPQTPPLPVVERVAAAPLEEKVVVHGESGVGLRQRRPPCFTRRSSKGSRPDSPVQFAGWMPTATWKAS